MKAQKTLSTTMLLALLTAGVAAMLVSCGSMQTTATQYAGATQYGPTDPANVAILRSEPTRPHDQIGEIVIDASTDPAPSVADIEKKLRKEGAKIGADAVVVVADKVQPTAMEVPGGWWDRGVEVEGRKVVGVGIKYR